MIAHYSISLYENLERELEKKEETMSYNWDVKTTKVIY